MNDRTSETPPFCTDAFQHLFEFKNATIHGCVICAVSPCRRKRPPRRSTWIPRPCDPAHGDRARGNADVSAAGSYSAVQNNCCLHGKWIAHLPDPMHCDLLLQGPRVSDSPEPSPLRTRGMPTWLEDTSSVLLEPSLLQNSHSKF